MVVVVIEEEEEEDTKIRAAIKLVVVEAISQFEGDLFLFRQHIWVCEIWCLFSPTPRCSHFAF